ncbi:YebC/PmpR family DNA-binding transcriptional regulator [Patescibacteria group bacterium]|nr:YebC/PmpR family DNA-binding transcriptional regulator [Patescibacteria group bacterium]MDE1940932.1 YebC/PmpR family DNA-binding transcriptional regulator [Patescibacteria group bacterium]
MSGHNKFSKIKHLKAKNDAEKSKHFGKLVRLIAVEAKKAKGDVRSPGLATAIDKARKENMPNDTIDRAIKKAITDNSAAMETIIYESYGPGGVAMLIEALTDNRNKAAQDIKHILSKNGFELASPGSASWAFQKTGDGWQPTSTMPLEDADIEILSKLVEELEGNEDVQEVFTNAE